MYNAGLKPLETLKKDNNKTLYNHCLLHLISLRGLCVKTNAKTTFITYYTCGDTINNYPMEPP